MSNINLIHIFFWKIKTLFKEQIRRYKYRKQFDFNKKWMNIHKGEKCFVIGNGPSLSISDLEKISEQGYKCFAANKIFMFFNLSNWRPDYYAVCDTTLYNNYKKEIDALPLVKFFPSDIYELMNNPLGKINLFSRLPFQWRENKPSFNPNLMGYFGEGGTITHHLLQLAVAMGFSEIYLIGIDFSFSWGIGPDGKYHEDPSIIDHFKEDATKTDTMPNLYLNLQAYKAAKKYAESHGVKIYNATRGGKLNVFERVDIDRILNNI